jgi:hypothetical protein
VRRGYIFKEKEGGRQRLERKDDDKMNKDGWMDELMDNNHLYIKTQHISRKIYN